MGLGLGVGLGLRVSVPWYGSRMSSWKESSFWLDHFHEGSLGPMAARRSRLVRVGVRLRLEMG